MTETTHNPALVGRLTRHVRRIESVEAGDSMDAEAAHSEAGWMRATRHFASMGLLTHAGVVEADKLLAASREWVRDMLHEGPGEGLGR